MVSMTRYDPIREALTLRNAMDQLFSQSVVNPNWMGTSQSMVAPMDVCETDRGYEVNIALPGVRPEDIELTARQNSLTIKGQHASTKEEKKENWVVKEIRSGSFGRSISFEKQIDVDKIDTSYENGVLTITVPYSEAAKPKKISIKKEEPKELSEAGAR